MRTVEKSQLVEEQDREREMGDDVIPAPVAPARPVSLPVDEQVVYGVDADGQLLLC
jgi:hypothetical protein